MILDKYKKASPLVKFVIKFISLLLIWELLYTLYLEQNTSIDYCLTKWVSDASLTVLSWFGYVMTGEVGVGECQVIFNHGQRLLHIAHPCNGLILQVLFIVFLVCFEGDWRVKLITIVSGSLGIFIINVVRVVALLLIKLYYPEYLDFSHKWLFTAIVYAFVFSLWLLWVNKLSKIRLGNNEQPIS